MAPDSAPEKQHDSPPSELQRPRSLDVFLGPHGLRAGWRLALYLALFFLLTVLSGFLASFFPRASPGAFRMSAFFFQEVAGFGVALAAAFFMARLERRAVGVYGLPLRAAFGVRFWTGFLFGLCEIALLVGIIAICGGYSFGPLVLEGRDLLRWALLWLVFFVFVGLLEEFLFRGYALYTLAEGIGFWPAAAVLSVVFGAVHRSNPGEHWLGVAGIVVTAMVFALVLRRTGNLWMAVGWHASFDFGETFLFSVPNSGIQLPGHLSSAALHGPTWLTGGTAGPEASVFSFLILGLAALAVHNLYPPAKQAVARDGQESAHQV